VSILLRVFLTTVLTIAIRAGEPMAFAILAIFYGPGLLACIVVFLVPMELVLEKRSAPWMNVFVAPLLGWLVPYALARMVSDPPQFDAMLGMLHKFGLSCAAIWVALYWLFFCFTTGPPSESGADSKH
jgi:fructose-specific phosphotransferase system IIC component